MIRVVLIGGPSGVGKSRLVDAMTTPGSQYTRPRSFTTRLPRPSDPNDEYEYLTVEEFQKRRDAGEFVNVDTVYGNLYSISYQSISEVMQTGSTVIKEIHPNNHAKLKQLLPGTISALLVPEHLEEWFVARTKKGESEPHLLARITEDRAFYQALDTSIYPFDIVLRVRQGDSTDKLKGRLLGALAAEDKSSEVEGARIEEVNESGYSRLASEFLDAKRITTANFHELCYEHFSTQLDASRQLGNAALDIGTGRGFLLPLLRPRFSHVVALDLSQEMVDLIKLEWPGQAVMRGSAFQLPFADRSFQVVTASLADPFLTRDALLQVRRVLADNGRFIFSTPSRTWADASRAASASASYLTTFLDSAGAKVHVYSFTYSDDELQALAQSCGFVIETFKIAYGRALREQHHPVSAALVDAAQRLHMELSELPILQLVTLRPER